MPRITDINQDDRDERNLETSYLLLDQYNDEVREAESRANGYFDSKKARDDATTAYNLAKARRDDMVRQVAENERLVRNNRAAAATKTSKKTKDDIPPYEPGMIVTLPSGKNFKIESQAQYDDYVSTGRGARAGETAFVNKYKNNLVNSGTGEGSEVSNRTIANIREGKNALTGKTEDLSKAGQEYVERGKKQDEKARIATTAYDAGARDVTSADLKSKGTTSKKALKDLQTVANDFNTMSDANLEEWKKKTRSEIEKAGIDAVEDGKTDIGLQDEQDKQESDVLKSFRKSVEEHNNSDTPDEKNGTGTARSRAKSFLEMWSGTHPTLFHAIFGKSTKKGGDNPLTFGQRLSLLGSALANFGANVTGGAQAGFNRQGFTGIKSNWENAINQYTEQGVKSLEKEQQAQGDIFAKSYISDLVKEKGTNWMNDVFEKASRYSDNPEAFDDYLRNQGLASRKDDIMKAYASNEFSKLDENTKQLKLETALKSYASELSRLDAKERNTLFNALIKAKESNFAYEAENYKNLKDTNAFSIYEGVIAKTLGDVTTTAGNVAGIIKDGIVKSDGQPQKIVRADGSEVILDPDDNVYATKNKLTSNNDNGKQIIPMSQNEKPKYEKKFLKSTRKPFTLDFKNLMKTGESISENQENQEKQRKAQRDRVSMQSLVNNLISQSLASNPNAQPIVQQPAKQ